MTTVPYTYDYGTPILMTTVLYTYDYGTLFFKNNKLLITPAGKTPGLFSIIGAPILF